MGLNTATESRNVDVMTAKNINELLSRNIEILGKPKAGKSGGENG